MYYSIGQGPLFRVASATFGNVWPDPVLGRGAYYVGVEGNRYSRTPAFRWDKIKIVF